MALYFGHGMVDGGGYFVGEADFQSLDLLRLAADDDMSDLRVWASQCQTANVSAGKYFTVSLSGCGQTQFTHIRLGPLQ